MKVPNVQTSKGKKPLTALPNEALITGFLAFSEESDELDLVRLLLIAEPSEKKAASILRECLEGRRKLVAVYPGNNEEPPKKATYIGAIPDGSLYLA